MQSTKAKDVNDSYAKRAVTSPPKPHQANKPNTRPSCPTTNHAAPPLRSSPHTIAHAIVPPRNLSGRLQVCDSKIAHLQRQPEESHLTA